MVKKSYFVLFLLVIICLSGLYIGTGYAKRGLGSVCTSSGDPNDTHYFPYKYICGSDNDAEPKSVTLNPINGTPFGRNMDTTLPTIRNGDPDNGYIFSYSGGFDSKAQPGNSYPTGVPKGYNQTDVNKLLVWVTIDGNDSLIKRVTVEGNPTGSDPGVAARCPGQNSGVFAPVYNFRDLAGGTNGNFGRNQSPAAWDGEKGLENCGSQGRMVYWKNVTQESTNYKFNIELEPRTSGQICVRLNLSIWFEQTPDYGGDTGWFTPWNDGGVDGRWDDKDGYVKNHDQTSAASHIVQQSRQNCYSVVVPPPPPDPPKPEGQNTCGFYSSKNTLADSSWYRFSYFKYVGDFRNTTSAYAGGRIERDTPSPSKWSDLTTTPVRQTRSGFDGSDPNTSALNVNYTTWRDDNALATYNKTDKTFYMNYGNPDGPDRNLYIESWTHIAADNDGVINDWIYWWSYEPKQDCFTASCTISADTGFGTDINGVNAGEEFRVSFTVTNTSQHGAMLPGSVDSNALSVWGNAGSHWTGLLKGIGVYLNAGDSITVSNTFTAPNAPGTYPLTAYVVYPNVFALNSGPRPGGGPHWGSPCNQVNINVYTPFELTPSGSGSYDDDEQPTAFNFRTSVRNNTDVAVNIDGSYSCVYESPSTTCPPSISQVNVPDSVAANARAYFYGSDPNNNASVAVSQPYNAGDKHCVRLHLPYTYGFVGPGGAIAEPGGAFSQDWCDSVKNRPFFKVDNASVSVGADYAAEGCTGNGVLAGWFKRDVVATDYFYNRGSSVDYSVMGKAKVSGVGSRQLTRFNSPTELTFANTVTGDIDAPGNSSEPDLGGNFGDARCIDDVTPPPDINAGEKRTGNTRLSDVFPAFSTPGTYTIGPVMGAGTNKALYVDGDILIDENIQINGPFTPGKGSSMVIKANKGNIYISSHVTNIDAILVATPDGNNKGEIYTCVKDDPLDPNDGYTKIPIGIQFDTCDTQLVFHGNVVARKVNMERTYGSLRDEKPATTGSNGGMSGGTNGISQKLVWVDNSDSKPSGYKKCVQIQENRDEDDDVWGNNWLCLSKADEDRDINLVYSHENKPSGAHCPILSIGAAIEFASNFGLIDEKEEDSWDNNWLCTNEFNTGVLVAVSLVDPTDTTRLCTVLRERDDDHADNIWKNTSGWRVWACMNKYAAGTPTPGSQPTAPSSLRCSIAGGTTPSTRGTCAAEIYEFSPALYMSQPRTGGSVDKKIKWDSITSLPPVL